MGEDHSTLGWSKFTKEVLNILAKEKPHLVFLFWGRDAQQIGFSLDFRKEHCVLQASHPSPLGAHKYAPMPFIGCNHFEKTNQYEAFLLSSIWSIITF